MNCRKDTSSPAPLVGGSEAGAQVICRLPDPLAWPPRGRVRGACAEDFGAQPLQADVRGRREEERRPTRGRDAAHLGKPVREQAPGRGRRHRRRWDRRRVVRYSDDCGVLASEEGDEQLEPGRVDEHHPALLGDGPRPAERDAHGVGALAHLLVAQTRLLRPVRPQPCVEPQRAERRRATFEEVHDAAAEQRRVGGVFGVGVGRVVGGGCPNGTHCGQGRARITLRLHVPRRRRSQTVAPFLVGFMRKSPPLHVFLCIHDTYAVF